MEYYTVKEVADIFKVSKQAVFKWITEGKINAEKIAGTTVRIRKEEIEKLKGK